MFHIIYFNLFQKIQIIFNFNKKSELFVVTNLHKKVYGKCV